MSCLLNLQCGLPLLHELRRWSLPLQRWPHNLHVMRGGKVLCAGLVVLHYLSCGVVFCRERRNLLELRRGEVPEDGGILELRQLRRGNFPFKHRGKLAW